VQSVEPFTFLKQHKGLYDPVQFLPYVLDDPQVRAATTPFGTFDFWDRHLPLVRYYGRAVNVATAARLLMMGRDRVAERDRGYKTLSMPWDGNSDHARRYWQSQGLEPDRDAIALFERYLGECRDAGIQIVLVSPPEYVDSRAFVPHRDEIARMVRAMRDKYGVPLLDYSENWMTDKPSLYSDVLHLNTRGVAIYTAELAADLKRLVPGGKL
jgi:hypothetical protein